MRAALLASVLALPLAQSAHAVILGGGIIGTGGTPAPTCTLVGVGNKITGGIYAHYGVVAYSAATCGNKLLNVCNSTGGVDVGCADVVSDATTGLLVSQTIAGITCPGANCTVKTAYDTSGSGDDATQAVIATRPTLPASCPGSWPACMQFSGSQYLVSILTGAKSQPITYGTIVYNTTASGFQSVLSAYNGVSGAALLFNGGGVGVYAGTMLGSGTTTAVHVGVGVINGVGSSFTIDGTATVTGDAGAQDGNLSMALGANQDGSSKLTGFVGEAFALGYAAGNTEQTNLCHVLRVNFSFGIAC